MARVGDAWTRVSGVWVRVDSGHAVTRAEAGGMAGQELSQVAELVAINQAAGLLRGLACWVWLTADAGLGPGAS